MYIVQEVPILCFVSMITLSQHLLGGIGWIFNMQHAFWKAIFVQFRFYTLRMGGLSAMLVKIFIIGSPNNWCNLKNMLCHMFNPIFGTLPTLLLRESLIFGAELGCRLEYGKLMLWFWRWTLYQYFIFYFVKMY